MKTERRHELQTNELADWVAKHYQTIAPYTKSILAVAIAVLVGYSAWNVISSRTREKEAAEWDHFDGGKEELNGLIARNSIGTPLGNMARLSLADINLSEGLETLLTNRPEALRSIKSARDDYALVANASKDPTITQLAWCGKAKAEEALGNLKEAVADYERLTVEGKLAIFNDYAKQRIAELKRPSVKEFYTVLAETQSKTSAAPSKRPLTELENPGEKVLPDSAVDKSPIFGKLPEEGKAATPDTTPLFPAPGKTDDKAPETPKTPDAAPDKSPAPTTPDNKTPTPKAPETPAANTPNK